MVLAALGLALAGCEPSDEGRTCTLLKAREGGGAVALRESELPAGKDIVSYGSADCQEWLCVRDAHYRPAPGATDALGYCSRACAPATGCRSIDPERPLTCRQLIADGEFLCVASLPPPP